MCNAHKQPTAPMNKAVVHIQIRERREALGWSHKQLAEAISEAEDRSHSLAWQTIQNWESGRTAPKRTRLCVVAKLLGTTVADLLGENSTQGWSAIPSLKTCLSQLAIALASTSIEKREVLSPLLAMLAKSPNNETLVTTICQLLEQNHD
jgi:transcriptional regulator with XRE-family HTH domain